MDESKLRHVLMTAAPLGAAVFCSICKLTLVWTGAFYVCSHCDPNVEVPEDGDAE